MKEKVYCPKCDRFEIQRFVGIPQKTRKSGRGSEIIITFLGGWVLHRIVYGKRDGDNIPISYRCLKCGHHFLSMETYEDELEMARQNRTAAIIIAALLGLISLGMGVRTLAFLNFSTQQGNPDILGTIVGFLLTAVLAVVGIWLVWSAHQRVNELDREMFELEQCEFRHRPLY